MYQKFDKFMKDFLDEDSAPDFWYDVASEEAVYLLSKFSESDWRMLLQNIDSQPVEFMRKLAYCLNDPQNIHQLKVVEALVNVDDTDLYHICMETLQFFLRENPDLIIENESLLRKIRNN